jgi:hypothetical protein
MGEILVCWDRAKLGRKLPRIEADSENEDPKARKNITGLAVYMVDGGGMDPPGLPDVIGTLKPTSRNVHLA